MTVTDTGGLTPPIGQFVNCNGVQVHYLERGKREGKTVVFLHGLGSVIQDFASSGVFQLLEDDYHILCFDRPGYGYTERPGGTIWTPERQADLFSLALQKLSVNSCVVVAHSWGVLAAIALTLRQPVLVRGLVLIGGYYFPDPHPLANFGSIAAVPVLGGLLRHTIGPLIRPLGGVDKAIKLAFAPNQPTAPFLRQFPVDLVVRQITLATIAEEAKLMQPSAQALQPRYGQLQCPIVIMVGLGDRITDPSQSERMRDALANQPTSPLLGQPGHPGTGHLLHHIHPGDVAAAVRSIP